MDEDKKEIIEVENTGNTENTQQEATQTKAKEEPKKERKGLCIASMVLGIIALVFFCIWYISIPCGILAIIFGILGIKSKNRGMAIAGLITGSIGVIVFTLIMVIAVVFGVAIGLTDVVNETVNDYDSSYYDDYDYDFDYDF